MCISRRSRSWRARLLLTLFMSTAACASWRTEPLTPQLMARQPDRVRVLRSDSSLVVLNEPELQGDTLVGTRKGHEVRIPLDSVQLAATPHFSAGKTFGAVLATAAAGFVVLLIGFAIYCHEQGCSDATR